MKPTRTQTRVIEAELIVIMAICVILGILFGYSIAAKQSAITLPLRSHMSDETIN